MMQQRKPFVSVLVVALSLVWCAGMASGQNAGSRPLDASLDWLSLETLQGLGVHLPSYLPSVQDQLAYQAKVPLHQEITVQWSASVEEQQAESSGSPLVKRWQHMQKSASISQLKTGDRPILVIATTSGGEVRAFVLCADTRSTTGHLDIQLPQDGQISKLIFLNVVAGGGVERIGQVELGLPNGAIQRVSKNRASAITSK